MQNNTYIYIYIYTYKYIHTEKKSLDAFRLIGARGLPAHLPFNYKISFSSRLVKRLVGDIYF